MFGIRTVDPADAAGKVAEIYEQFPPELGIPPTFRMLSASPALMERQWQTMQFWQANEALSRPFLVAVRYLMTGLLGLSECQAINGKLLRIIGLSAEEVEALSGDPADWPLSEPEQALLEFVVRSVPERRSASADELSRLRDLGWTEATILEALAYGGMVLGTVSCMAVLAD